MLIGAYRVYYLIRFKCNFPTFVIENILYIKDVLCFKRFELE